MSRNRPEPARHDIPYEQLSIYYLEGRIRSPAMEHDPSFIGNWEEDGFSFLFFSRPREDVVAGLLAEQPALKLVDRYEMSYEEWLGERFEGFDVGRISVRPAWGRQQTEAFTLLLDPGVVFGTGTHATTRDCLKAIDALYRGCSPRRVLDLGTGSGILALAAARLGAAKVAAVDLNLLAVRTARRNARLNGLDDRMIAVQGRAQDLLPASADLVIANLHHEVMVQIIEDPVFPRLPHFILSGLLRSEAADIESRLARMPVRIRDRWEAEGVWYTFWGEAAGRSA